MRIFAKAHEDYLASEAPTNELLAALIKDHKEQIFEHLEIDLEFALENLELDFTKFEKASPVLSPTGEDFTQELFVGIRPATCPEGQGVVRFILNFEGSDGTLRTLRDATLDFNPFPGYHEGMDYRTVLKELFMFWDAAFAKAHWEEQEAKAEAAKLS